MFPSHYIYFRLGARSLAEVSSAGSHRFFEDKATEHLLGEGILPEHLNDYKIGRVMDKISAYGLSELFLLIALAAAKKHHINLEFSHLDSSSFSVHGQYKRNEYLENKLTKNKLNQEIEPIPITSLLIQQRHLIEEVGRAEWKRESDYHRRSLSETTMFRFKIIFGNTCSRRTFDNQASELLLACAALNRMTHLGMPDSYALSF